jgi:hypothetical protein
MLARHSIALSVAATIGIATPPGEPELAGRWSGETFAAGAPALITLDLFANGTYARRITTSSELGWSMAGETLFIAPLVSRMGNEATYGKASAVLVKIAGDLMTQSAGSTSIILRRVTPAVADGPMLGRWEGQGDDNGNIVQDFTPDGRLIVTVTVSREAGRWSASDKEIKWETEIPQPARKRNRFRMQKGKLLLFIAREIPPLELTRVLSSN